MGEPGYEISPEDAISPARARTRHRILVAGLDLWRCVPPTAMLCPSSAVEVARHAGVTRSTFYSYWPTLEDYARDLIEYALQPLGDERAREIVDSTRRLTGAPADVVATLEQSSRARMERYIADDRHAARLALAAQATDPEVVDRLRSWFSQTRRAEMPAHELVRERWGLEPRPPFTADDIAAVIEALVDGLSLRARVEAEFPAPELFARMMVLMGPVCTRPIGDRGTLEDVTAELHHYPHRAIEERARVASVAALTDSATETPRRYLEAAAELIERMPWSEVTLFDVATVAGVASATLRSQVPSKAALGTELFVDRVLERWSVLDLPADPPAAIDAQLEAMLESARSQAGLLSSVHLVMAGLAPSHRECPVCPLAEELLAVLERNPALRTCDQRQLAYLIVRTVLLQLRADRFDETAGLARAGAELVLAGAAARDGRPG